LAATIPGIAVPAPSCYKAEEMMVMINVSSTAWEEGKEGSIGKL